MSEFSASHATSPRGMGERRGQFLQLPVDCPQVLRSKRRQPAIFLPHARFG